jgi:hypothetical protein
MSFADAGQYSRFGDGRRGRAEAGGVPLAKPAMQTRPHIQALDW